MRRKELGYNRAGFFGDALRPIGKRSANGETYGSVSADLKGIQFRRFEGAPLGPAARWRDTRTQIATHKRAASSASFFPAA
jgi:hypothetical protein